MDAADFLGFGEGERGWMGGLCGCWVSTLLSSLRPLVESMLAWERVSYRRVGDLAEVGRGWSRSSSVGHEVRERVCGVRGGVRRQRRVLSADR